MKYLLISSIILSAFLYSCSIKQSEVIIKGQLAGVIDGTPLHLYDLYDSAPFMTDTIYDEKFNFVFQDSTPGNLREMSLTLQDDKKVIINGTPIWISAPTQVNVSIDAQYPHIWNVESNIPEQIEANKYKAATRIYNIEVSNILEKMNNAYANIEKRENQKKADSLRAVLHSIQDSISNIEFKVFEENTTYSDVWYSKLFQFAKNISYSKNTDSQIYEKIITTYNSLTEEQKSNEILQDVPFLLFPPKAANIGDDFKELELQDINEQVHKIADYEGKYRLLDFWASWCGPCLMAMPEVEKLAETYKNNLIVLTINIEDKNDWLKYSKENKMLEHNLFSTTKSQELDHYYQIKGFPHYVLIAPNNTIIDIWGGYSKGSIEAKLKEHLKK